MSEKPCLLQVGSMTPRMRDRLSAEWEIIELFAQKDRAGCLAARGGDVVGILTDGHWGVPADVLAGCPNLKVASSYGVGYDGIDTEACNARGVLVANTPGVLNDEVADTAILLWLAVFRQLIPADRWARSGTWEAQGAYPLTRAVRKTTLGILGLGRIGQTIAARAEVFGAEVVYHSRTQKDVPYRYYGSLVEMAEASDTLVCITPGGPETRNMVNADVLQALGSNGVLINVARGSVVDEPALVAALEAGTIAGAGLDVFAAEPKIPDALKTMDNVVLTPHMASGTVETRRDMGDLACDNLSQFLKDGTVLTPVPECVPG